MRLLRCIAQAVVTNGLKALAGGVPFLGGLVEIADDAWKRYREQPARNAPPPEAALSTEVEALARAPAPQVRQQIAEAVKDAAANQPAEVQVALTSYLTQVPAMIRRSLRRPSDPGGTTVPANRGPHKAADLLPFLPPKLPRFRPGDRPLPGVNWELVELLGVGGFGEVWKAHHPDLTGITAALKFCLDPEAGKLLRQEASALNRVMQAGRHPGIVPLRQAYLDGDPVCLEYEYVEGGDLGGLIQEMHQGGQVKPEEVARWMLHLAATVRFAHQMKPPLVHRDLKPANILVQRSPDGQFSLRVADFGISAVAASQALDEAARTPTSRNSLLATAVRGAYTPLYASPQQMKGEPADPRDDVHALGVIWYQMLTGDLSQGPLVDCRDELTDRGVPSSMIDLLARCVAGRAERRLADAGEVGQQLETLLQAGVRPPPPAPAARPQAEFFPERADLQGLAATLPKELPQEFANSLGMRFVLIPAGKFMMGSWDPEPHASKEEWPQHPVEITRPYYLGIHQVTQEQYEKVIGTNPSHFTREKGGGPNHPVESVSWEEAIEFCRRLSTLPEEKVAGRIYRLPTEAEWEYACRAGVPSSIPFSFGPTLSSTQANFDGNRPYGGAAKGPYLERTASVGSYPPNAFGLYDMHGNVWEWCQDWYNPHYYNQSPWQDPQGPQRGEYRVLRGGSWLGSGHHCRSGYRITGEPGNRTHLAGFRVVCIAPVLRDF